jgi:hypothetical protein
VAFQRGLSGGFSKTKGGRRKLTDAFRGAGVIKPPAGTYDPGLDAGFRAAGRGYGDLRQDLERDGERASSAYGLGTSRLGEDFGLQMGRFGEDEAFGRSEISRGFARLGSAQSDQAAAMGVSAGGATAESAGKRAAAEGIQQGQLAQRFARARADLETQRSRGMDDMGTEFQYGQSDRATVGARAGRENTFYGQDVSDQRYFQAAQSGWRPPAKPKKKGKR